MKIVLAALVCLAAAVAVFAQNGGENSDEPPAKLSLAKKEKDGTISENREVFGVRDIPIICYVDLAKTDPVEVRLAIVAVKAAGLRPNSEVVTVRYKTGAGENMVTFTAKPKDVWAPGEYRSDVFLNGSIAASVTFRISDE